MFYEGSSGKHFLTKMICLYPITFLNFLFSLLKKKSKKNKVVYYLEILTIAINIFRDSLMRCRYRSLVC